MTQKFDIATKVTTLVKDQLEDYPSDHIDPLMSFEELGFDWLATTGLIMDLEQEFSIIISDEDAEQFINIQSIVLYVQKIKSA